MGLSGLDTRLACLWLYVLRGECNTVSRDLPALPSMCGGSGYVLRYRVRTYLIYFVLFFLG